MGMLAYLHKHEGMAHFDSATEVPNKPSKQPPWIFLVVNMETKAQTKGWSHMFTAGPAHVGDS